MIESPTTADDSPETAANQPRLDQASVSPPDSALSPQEIALKEREIEIKAREVSLTARFQALSFVSAVIGACLAFFGTSLVNSNQAEANRKLEEMKARESKDLERQKLEGNLILTFLADKDATARKENLLFLNRAEYIHLPEDLIEAIETGEQLVPRVDPKANFGPPEGLAPAGSAQALLNQQKNRSEEPGGDNFDTTVDLGRLLTAVDEHALNTAKAAIIEGFVLKVKLGGVSTANMNERDSSKRDLHIYVAPQMQSGPEEIVMCVVTPRFRAKHSDWSLSALSQTLVNKHCRISGWLYFDPNLARYSANNPRRGNMFFRGTSWELHPVTAIEVTN